MAKASKSSDAFVQVVERALEHFGNADWLGEQSPLAAPYFLGSLLDNAKQTGATARGAAARGAALQQALLNAARTLSAEQHSLLNATFFQRKPNLNNTGVALEMKLSESTYYRRRVEAIAAVANALNQSIIPPLRNELPNTLPFKLIGRAAQLQHGITALRQGLSLAITGRSGAGKTSLGATLAHQWGEGRVFWFTVRPGLNDNLNSFAFALAHFLRELGASNTWRQLVADRGASNAAQVLGLLRHDLAALATQPVLLCIDESDQLRLETRAHAQVIHAIEALSANAPVLLISQQLLIEAQQQLTLTGLSPEESAALLTQEGCGDLSAVELGQLHEVTRGMPALLKLSALLRRAGESTAAIVEQLQDGRSVEALFNRIWKRLSEAERGLLMALATFRAAAPRDAWPEQHGLLAALIERDLVQVDTQGGVAVLSHVREFIAQRVPADARPALHQLAAEIREVRGEYTEAAYHYLQAEQAALALWLWFTHRDQERERGQAHAVAELFSQVKQSDLPDDEDRKALALLRAEYAIAQGEGSEAEQALGAERWPWSHPALAFVRQLQGDALELQGRVEQALARYREGIQHSVPQGQGQRVRLQVKSGYIYVARLRDLAQAQEEADVALWRAEQFKGNVEEERGRFAAARQHYEAALQIAQALENNAGAVAEVHHHLGHLYMRMGQAEAAIRHLNIAIAHAEKTGQPVDALYDRLNLASAHIVAGQPAAAEEHARGGLALAREIQHPFLIAGLAACTAEALLGQERWDEAEQLALQSLSQEEEVHRPYALTVLGQVQGQRGQPRQAEQTLHLAIESAQATQDKFAEAPAWRALAALLAERDPAQSKQAAQQADALVAELGLAAL